MKQHAFLSFATKIIFVAVDSRISIYAFLFCHVLAAFVNGSLQVFSAVESLEKGNRRSHGVISCERSSCVLDRPFPTKGGIACPPAQQHSAPPRSFTGPRLAGTTERPSDRPAHQNRNAFAHQSITGRRTRPARPRARASAPWRALGRRLEKELAVEPPGQ